MPQVIQKENKLRVLIVENSPVVAGRIEFVLKEIERIELIGKAANSTEAMTMIQVKAPDVVLLDISIPGKSGIHVLQEIKKNQPSVKVIVLTNYSSSYYRNICLDLGADYFFDKSTEFEKIPGVLDSMPGQFDLLNPGMNFKKLNSK